MCVTTRKAVSARLRRWLCALLPQSPDYADDIMASRKRMIIMVTIILAIIIILRIILYIFKVL